VQDGKKGEPMEGLYIVDRLLKLLRLEYFEVAIHAGMLRSCYSGSLDSFSLARQVYRVRKHDQPWIRLGFLGLTPARRMPSATRPELSYSNTTT
jgi:hypothetical protein